MVLCGSFSGTFSHLKDYDLQQLLLSLVSHGHDPSLGGMNSILVVLNGGVYKGEASAWPYLFCRKTEPKLKNAFRTALLLAGISVESIGDLSDVLAISY